MAANMLQTAPPELHEIAQGVCAPPIFAQMEELRHFITGLRCAERPAPDELVKQHEELIWRFEALGVVSGDDSKDISFVPSAHANVSFDAAQTLELQGACGTVWRGLHSEAVFPKPGTNAGFRRVQLLKQLANDDEVEQILKFARTSLDFDVGRDSVDQCPTYEHYVIRSTAYVDEGLAPLLRPIVEDRILPYVRQQYQAPDAVVSSALLRRYLPDERRAHPTHVDGHSFCTAVLGLNAGEFDGGLYVQPRPGIQHRQFVDIGRGDLILHQYDLPHGVNVFNGRRYSMIFWIKDCMESALSGSTPWFDTAAKEGDVDAMVALAQKLQRSVDSGNMCGGESELAVTWYKKAAEMGQVEAQINLGAMFEAKDARGGCASSGQQAVHWWQMAADVGDSCAQRLLGQAYSSGTCGLPLDDEEAARLMKLAAEQDDATAMLWLWKCYGKSSSLTQARQSTVWLKRAAAQGHPQSQTALANAFLSGSAFTPRSPEWAALWLFRAARNGDARAQRTLKSKFGKPLTKADFGDAVKWLHWLGHQGDSDCQHGLAMLHLHGLCGLPEDRHLAFELFTKAADQRHVGAAELLRSFDWIHAQESEAPPSCENDARKQLFS